MTDYKIIYTRTEDQWWTASVPRIPGCHTQGGSIDQARQRIVEAIGLYVVTRTVTFEETVTVGESKDP